MRRPLFLVFLIVLLLVAAMLYVDIGENAGWFEAGV